MALLVLAAGFCVFDRHEHDGADDHASVELDLCLGMLTAPLPVVLAAGLPLVGSSGSDAPDRVPEFLPHVPAPPPKRLA